MLRHPSGVRNSVGSGRSALSFLRRRVHDGQFQRDESAGKPQHKNVGADPVSQQSQGCDSHDENRPHPEQGRGAGASSEQAPLRIEQRLWSTGPGTMPSHFQVRGVDTASIGAAEQHSQEEQRRRGANDNREGMEGGSQRRE